MIRELTAREKQKIVKLVKERCANYWDDEYFTGCLPFDHECVMFSKVYCGNAMCRYFRESVLPNDPELEAILTGVPTKRCKYCGKLFSEDGRRVYCSEKCSTEAKKKQTAERVRRHRERKADM